MTQVNSGPITLSGGCQKSSFREHRKLKKQAVISRANVTSTLFITDKASEQEVDVPVPPGRLLEQTLQRGLLHLLP